MAEYIERDTVLDGLENINWYHTLPNGMLEYGSRSDMDSYIPYDETEAMVMAIPAADVVPVRHGRWIRDKVAFYLGCSECGCYLEYAVDTFLDNGDHYHFCPNCGTRMDKDGDA